MAEREKVGQPKLMAEPGAPVRGGPGRNWGTGVGANAD